jgi:hypothetical protein
LVSAIAEIKRIDMLVVGTGFDPEKESNAMEWFLVRQNGKVEFEFFPDKAALLTKLETLGHRIEELSLKAPKELVQEGNR